jgi:sialic acid synthase SpsE/D-lyxose ketol-isomerase
MSIITEIPKKFFIFEMANNHMGDLNHAIKLIDEFSKIKKKFSNFEFGFKLQFRNLKTFIHKSKIDRIDLNYIKRFKETELSELKFKKIVHHIKKSGFISVTTPFDENSVDLANKLGIEIIKIASCSFNDWSLLEKIVTTNKPIIASTAGANEEQVDKVISFLKNRQKNFSIMHCVAEYPTPNKKLNLSRLKYLINKYPEINFGYSTHEDPSETEIISIAIGMGAQLFEKHVGLETEKYNLNKYSASPQMVNNWLISAKKTYEILGNKKNIFKKNIKELISLNSLKRGIFAKRNIKKGTIIRKNDFYLAFPPEEKQILADDVSKYNQIISKKNIKKDKALTEKNSEVFNNRKKIYKIINDANFLLKKSNHTFSGPIEYEISHHYGIENFNKYGLVMLNIINGDYCKKILVLFQNQKHPEQFHKIKKETFHILYGNLELKLNGKNELKKKGDIITINPKVKHEFSTKTGAVIEEISTTHYKADSFYTDKKIHENKSRKTIIKFVWE